VSSRRWMFSSFGCVVLAVFASSGPQFPLVQRVAEAGQVVDASVAGGAPTRPLSRTVVVDEPVVDDDGDRLSGRRLAVPGGWSDPATWGGAVPGGGDAVTIPAGKTVVLDGDVKVKNLTVEGTLTCAKTRINLEADWIVVHGDKGRFKCGSKRRPFEGGLTVTLSGAPSEDAHGMGARVLGAMSGGVIKLHGRSRTSWVKLGATAQVGADTIEVDPVPSGWRRGMSLVIGSSTEDPRQAEVRVIKRVHKKKVTLTEPLQNTHFGERQKYKSGSGKWTVDTRAPVGVLSRNIVIQGPEDAATSQFGAHTMVMGDAKAFFSNVSMRRVGQKSLKARYPFHWHLVGDGKKQYIRNSSIYDSYNRCVTVHGTDNTTVSNNVCYNHLGHGYFLEDGNEQGNVIKGNLGVQTVRPKAGEEILATDNSVNPAAQGPATFWISNPNNVVKNNVAAGSDGLGYWYHLANEPVRRYDGSSVTPRTTVFGGFRGNIVSSSPMGYSSCPKDGGPLGFEASNKMAIKNLTVFMTSADGVWPCGTKPQIFTRMKVLDSGRSAFVAPQPMEIRKSLFVANSAMAGVNGGNKGRSAIGHYDQGGYIHDTHFVGYTKAQNSSLLHHIGGAIKNYQTRVERVTFEPKTFAAWDGDASGADSAAMHGSVLFDVDGSLGAGANMALLPAVPLFGSACPGSPMLEEGTFGVMCRFRLIKARFNGIDSAATDLFSLFRNENGKITESQFGTFDPNSKDYAQAFAVPNQSFHYGIRFHANPGGNLSLGIAQGWPGDQVRFEMRGLDGRSVIKSPDWRQVNQLSELESAKDAVWFKDGDTIHLRFELTGSSKWTAERQILVGY
jgi:cell surface hyaluronidase